MRICFRVDSSIQMGSGHLVRCHSLATALLKAQHSVFFISRNLPGNLNSLTRDHGFELFEIQGVGTPNLDFHSAYSEWLGDKWENDAAAVCKIIEDHPADWMVVDHYALDYRWENQVRSEKMKLLVIDDLANRFHLCDILLDQNLVANLENRYDSLLKMNSKLLLGPQFVLLRAEFAELRQAHRIRSGQIQRILIYFGAVDLPGLTLKAIDAIEALGQPDIEVDVIVGQANPNADSIRKRCVANRFNYYRQTDTIAKLMVKADLAIGAGGTTTWERCCLGLPSIVTSIAANQDENISYLESKELIIKCNNGDSDYGQRLSQELKKIINNPEKVQKISRLTSTLVDGRGCQRVVKEIEALRAVA